MASGVVVEYIGGTNALMIGIGSQSPSEFVRTWITKKENKALFGFTMICPILKINGKNAFPPNWESCYPSLSKVKVINIVGAEGERVKRTQLSAGIQEAWAPGTELIGDPALIGKQHSQDH